MKKSIKNTFKYCLYTSLLIGALSCKKLLDVAPPPTSTSTDIVFSDNSTAAAVMNGVYTRMVSNSSNVVSLSIYPELSADNLTLFALNTQPYLSFYKNVLTPVAAPGSPAYWTHFYTIIYNVNSVIENAPKSSQLSPVFRDKLMGEAYFMRAFSYFYLVNLYGDVPLVLTTDYIKTAVLSRTPTADVYKQIIEDLQQAEQKLDEKYLDATLMHESAERVRPNKFAAKALLARVYLYRGEYANAVSRSTEVINRTDVYDTVSTPQTFLKESRETIWSLQPVRTGENTLDARFYALRASGPNQSNTPSYLSERLLSRFEPNDKRKTSWTNSVTVTSGTYPYIYKYKVNTITPTPAEYTIVLRIGELLLIRAEARLLNNDLTGAIADINKIRARAGLPPTSAQNKDDLLLAVMQERRVELFGEWGHRWFDLKRTGKIDEVMTSAAIEKGTTWETEWQLYPIPNLEILNNTNLEQNSGYKN